MEYEISFASRRRTIQQAGIAPATLLSAFDAATTAWAAAVVTNGGTVSDARKSIVDTLITGLKADGVWTKLDRLWLYAAENAASALTDLIATTLATAVNSPTFTADDGYTGNGSTAYIDSNSNPTTIAGNYVQDSACQFAWDNTGGSDVAPLAGGLTGGAAYNYICPDNAASFVYALNANNIATGSGTADGATGLYLVNRANATTVTMDENGSQLSTLSSNSLGQQNISLRTLTDGAGNFTARQASCMGFGGSLSTGERTALYNRLRTYMTAVGVP